VVNVNRAGVKMPSHFTKTDENGTQTLPFTRFHYNEITGERVPTKAEVPNDIFILTEQQANHLVNNWNEECKRNFPDTVYAVYDDVE
jgi:hypothetical protein